MRRKNVIRPSDTDYVVRSAFQAPNSAGSGDPRRPSWANAAPSSEARVWSPRASNAGASVASRLGPQHAAESGTNAEEAIAEQVQKLYDEALAQGRDDGYKEGLEQGHRDAEEQIQSQIEAETTKLQEVGRSLEGEIERLKELRSQLMDQLEEDAVQLTLTIASKLAAEAQLGETDWVAPLIREASKALTEGDRVVCTISPELASRLQDADIQLAGQGVLLDVRPDLGPLDIVVESRFGRVDASFEERLEHMRRAALEHLQTPDPEMTEQEVA